MSAVLPIDTDVLIDYLRDRAQAVAYLENLNSLLAVSSITVAELYSGVRDGKETVAMEIFLQGFRVIPVDFEVSRRGGLLRRQFSKSHGVGLADALIAATAEINNFDLVTLNRKHYPMLDKVIVPYEKDH